ncbi:hypothetical protein SAMN05216311_110152 [Chitinophaga sp. CF418]|nr:hypothetical protein SAMN05216311_110152 [Chitinophaga sp. CF418]
MPFTACHIPATGVDQILQVQAPARRLAADSTYEIAGRLSRKSNLFLLVYRRIIYSLINYFSISEV